MTICVRSLLSAALIVALTACGGGGISGSSSMPTIQTKQSGTVRDAAAFRVLTYNVDEGSDFTEIRQATTATQFLLAVGATITQVRATNPAERMQAVAAQISAAAAALVSLQEVDQWSSGSYNPVSHTCGTLSVEYDMLAELMGALAARGAHYQVRSNAISMFFRRLRG